MIFSQALRIAKLNEDVSALDITQFPQPLPERLKLRAGSLGTSLSVDESYPRNSLRLLCLSEPAKSDQASANHELDDSFMFGCFDPKSKI